MSCFVVSELTITDSVALMRKVYGPAPDPVWTDLGQMLLRLNISAFAARYSHNESAMAEIPEYERQAAEYRFAESDISDNPAQLLSSAECLKYQCSEIGPHETFLYNRLVDAIANAKAEDPKLGSDESTVWDRYE